VHQGRVPRCLVTEDGKVYKIANQDKVVASAGMIVTVAGKLKGDTLTVACEVKGPRGLLLGRWAAYASKLIRKKCDSGRWILPLYRG